MKHGKRYTEAAKLADRSQHYDAADTVDMIKKTANAKFDETVKLHVRTGADGRHTDQQIRGAVALPHNTGKMVHTSAFAKGLEEGGAKAAGADFVGGQEPIPKVQNRGWFGFDVVVVTPDMMDVAGRLGKVLGPKGLIPNPKSDMVTMSLTKAIADIRAGRAEHHLGKANIIHYPVGKASFTEGQLRENLQALLDVLNKAKPSSLKGAYMKSAVFTSTMGPDVKPNTAKIAN